MLYYSQVKQGPGPPAGKSRGRKGAAAPSPAGRDGRGAHGSALQNTRHCKQGEEHILEEYRTIRGTAAGEYEEKKSRFLAAAAHVESEAEAVAFLEQVRAANRTARHNVYAYKLREGSRERYSDDGEPAKTAGTPVLEVIGHSGLTDLIVVVTRYFGGILLGTGGLVRAYTTAASRALDAAEKVTVQPVVKLSTMVEYPLYERVDLLVAAAGGRMEAPVFTDKVALTWQMRAGTEAPLLEQLRELTRGRGRVEVSEPFYGAV